MAKRLSRSFYLRDDVVTVARELLGKKLVTSFDGRRSAGIIVETEAYAGIIDRASHAYGDRRTRRTEVMYGEGGLAYVYLCYGLFHLFNVVAGPRETPLAVLVRAIAPAEGLALMQSRCQRPGATMELGNGPGKLTRALGIQTAHTGMSLLRGSPVWIEEGLPLAEEEIASGTRVGVAYALEDALLPYRFWVRDHPAVSRAKGL